MDIQDIHVGNQLHVSTSSVDGLLPSPVSPNIRDPVCLGIGGATIPGSIFANGVVLIGSPLS